MNEPHQRRYSSIGMIMVVAAVCFASAGCDLFTSAETRIARAEEKMAVSDPRGAMVELKNVLQKEPDNVRALLDLTEVRLALSDPSGAQRELKHALDSGATASSRPGNMPAPADLDAKIRITLGKGSELLADIDSGKLSLPEPARSLYRGQALLQMRQAEEARAAFESALAKDPNSNVARIGLAQALAVQRQPEAALKELDIVVARQPDAADAWITRSLLLTAMRRPKEAAESLDEAYRHIQKLPLHQQVRLLAALSEKELSAGRIDEAVKFHVALEQLAPQAPMTELLAARISIARKDYTDAVAKLQKLLVAAPEFVPARILLGSAFIEQKNFAQAEQQLNMALQDEPDNKAAAQLLAKARAGLGLPVEPGEKKPQMPPELAARLQKAETLGKAGQKDKAIAEYESLLKDGNGAIGVLNNLAWLYYETGDSRAVPTARKAYEMAPKVPEVADTYGWLLVEAGSVEEGLKILEAAAKASSNSQVDAHYREAQARAGKKAKH